MSAPVPPWYQGSYADIAARVGAGPFVDSAAAAQDAWSVAREVVLNCDSLISGATGGLAGAWTGSAADAFRQAMTPLSAWALGAADDAVGITRVLAAQSDAAAALRRNLPPAPAGADPAGVQIATEDAQRLATQYAAQTDVNRDRLGLWSAPPQVTVQVPAPGPARAAAVRAPAPVAVAAIDPAAGRPAAGGTVSAGPAGAGAAAGAFAPAGSGPAGGLPPGAASGSPGAGLGSPAPVSGLPTAGAGALPGAAAAGPGVDPLSTGTAPGPFGLPGPPAGTTTRGRTGAAGEPGPSAGAGASPLGPLLPPPTGGVVGGSRAVGGYGGVDGLPPGAGGRGVRPPSGALGDTARGPTWRDVVTPAPAAPPAPADERGALYPPMLGGSAAGGAPGGHRRSGFLVDDSAAFVHGRAVTPAVIDAREAG